MRSFFTGQTNRMHRTTIAMLALLVLAGCGVHRIDIQQGNYLDAEQVAKIKPGMTKSQVRFVLGNPVLQDPFHSGRWDYVYYFQSGVTREVTHRRLIVWFEGDTVARTETQGEFDTPPDLVDPLEEPDGEIVTPVDSG